MDVYAALGSFIENNRESLEAWCEENNYDCFSPSLEDLSEEIDRKLEAGWGPTDVYRYMILTEELDPRWSEAVAIRKMRKLNSLYS